MSNDRDKKDVSKKATRKKIRSTISESGGWRAVGRSDRVEGVGAGKEGVGGGGGVEGGEEKERARERK